MLGRRSWFSAQVRVAVLIEGHGAYDFRDSVFVFKATSWDSALARAIDLGRTLETDYVNADGEAVRWRVMGVQALDQLAPSKKRIDGAEVFSESVGIPEGTVIDFDATFSPEDSNPGQTGV